MNIKDDKLKENLKKYKENIKSVCRKSPKLQEYADQLLNSVTVIVNDIILNELEKRGVDKRKLEEKRKKLLKRIRKRIKKRIKAELWV